MSRTARNKDTEVHRKMALLADFVSQMDSEEIWAFLDSLFPSMSEDEKEDLYGQIITSQSWEGGSEPHPAADVFAEIENERGLAR